MKAKLNLSAHMYTYFLSALVCFALFFSPDLKAQSTGTISGTVVDAETGETVIGANVTITGTIQGSATDLDGSYAIRRLEPGTYSITVSYISYTTTTITDIEVEADKTTIVNISLKPEVIGLNEFVVTAAADRSGQAGLLSIQRKSIPVQDGISSEQISRLGDGDVGAAIKRITGVTVQNGKDVFVRGLGNRYSNVQLNGSQLPSTDPNKKEAPIDLFGSGLVSDIVVQKTYTADQSAEFSGGSVKITTKEFPEDRSLKMSYSTEYTSLSTFENTLTSGGSSTDFLGFDDGKRSLPSVINNERVNENNANKVAEGLHNTWDITDEKSAIPSQSFSVNYGNQFNADRMPIGMVSSFSYKFSRNLQSDKTTRSILNFTDSAPNYYSDYIHNEGIESGEMSGMLSLFVKPSPVNKIGIKTLYSNAGTHSRSILQGPYQNGTTRIGVMDFDRRTIFSTILEAESYFQSFMASTLTARIGYNVAIRNRPDRRTTRYNLSGDQFRFAPFGDNNGHFFSDQEDRNYEAGIKYEFNPLDFLNISFGGNARLKDRSFTARRITYRDQVAPFITDISDQHPGVILSDQNIQDGIIEMIETTQFGLNQSDWYDGNQSIYSGFASASFRFMESFSVDLGGRLENSIQTIDVPISLGGEYEEASRVDNMDFLPAVNVTYSLTERTNIRAAFSRTLARPAFREISNFNFADFFGGRRIYGNPELERTRITNYDVRLETYPKGGELFAVSLFYKQFENPIELFYRFTDNNEVFYNNAKEADVYGVEIEGRKNVTTNWQVIANASFIESKTHIHQEDQNRVANIERPMMGQSPFSVNLSTFYVIPQWDMNLSLSYNTFGERIVTVGKNAQIDDEYEQPFHDLGAKIDYKFGQTDLSFEVSNFLNQNREYTQNGVTTFSYSPGVTCKMGISFSL